MPAYDVALSWIILAPLAFIQSLLAILVILHYRPLFHSCDVALMSLHVTMAMGMIFLLPVQAVLELGDFYWSQELCTFYVWLSFTLRSSSLLVILVINVYWMASFRVTLKGQMFSSSKSVKLCVCLSWLVSVVLGFIPAIGGPTMFHYYEEGACKFLPANVSIGFALAFIVMALLSFIMACISSTDSMMLLRRIKSIAMTRRNAGRFRLPNSGTEMEQKPAAHAQYNELNVSTDLCRLVIILTVVSSALNGLPLMVSQFVQVIQYYDRVAMESTLLYLLLLEALVVPHILWLLSDRYRHAATYTWKVFCRRDQSYREEDSEACVLQAFRFQTKATMPRNHTNGSGPPRVNGAAASIQEDELSVITSHHTAMTSGNSVSSLAQPSSSSKGATNGRAHAVLTTELDDGMAVIAHVSTSAAFNGKVKAKRCLEVSEESTATSQTREKMPPKKSPRNFVGVKPKQVSNGVPVAMETLQTPSSVAVTRSSSSALREQWKEKMRKKHLPAVLYNKSTDDAANTAHAISDSKEAESDYAEIDTVNEGDQRKQILVHSPSTDSHYYISSDYHYSYLGGSSSTLNRQMTSEEAGMYESCDIVSVLDEPTSDDVDIHQGKDKVIYSLPVKKPTLQSSHVDKSTPGVLKKESEIQNVNIPKSVANTTRSTKLGSHEMPFNGKANILEVQFEDDDDTEYSHPLHTDVIEATATLKSFIRRDNYRKFLPYTNLVISSVDVEDDTSADQTTTSVNGALLNTADVHLSQEDMQIKHPKKENPVHPMNDTFSKENAVDLTSDDIVKGKQNGLSNHQTIGGTELLKLKMMKVRKALAMDSTDDSTYSGDSDADRSMDWSSDANDHLKRVEQAYYSVDNVSTLNESEGLAKQKKEILPKDTLQKDIIQIVTLQTETLQNDTLQKDTLQKDTLQKDTLQKDTLQKDTLQKDTLQKDTLQKDTLQKDIIQIVTLQTETLQNDTLQKDTLQKDTLQRDALLKDTVRTNPDKTAPKMLLKNVKNPGSVDSPSRPETNSQTYRQALYSNNPFLRESFEHNRSSLNNQNSLNSNPFMNPHNIFIGQEVMSSFASEAKVTNSALSSVASGVATKHAHQSNRSGREKSSRHTSSEDELDSIFEEQPNNVSENPFSKSEETDTMQTWNDESDSDASDRSVIIKPYGRRRPAWMEDPIMNSGLGYSFDNQMTSESDTDTLGESNHFPSFQIRVTDDSSDNVVEYDFDSVNISGVVSDSYSSSYYRPPAIQGNVVQYHFDEDIERGFEDALSAGYISQGHAYGGLGLCFESIKEEPEESQSESLTSLEGTELKDPANTFKTQAIISRPPSRSSVTSPSFSYPPPSTFQDDFEEYQFPAFERTSADGSEEIVHSRNGNRTPPKAVKDPWGFTLPAFNNKNNETNVHSPSNTLKENHEFYDLETADNIVTALAFKPGKSNPFDQSDWSNESCDFPLVHNEEIKTNNSPYLGLSDGSQANNVTSAYF